MRTIVDVDIASAEFKADPFPFYERLRREAPVFRLTLPDRQQVWLVSRYDDVSMVLKDERFVKNRFDLLTKEQLAKQPWIPKVFMPLARNMLDLDPPDHTRIRALVQKAFSAQRVEQMQGRIEVLAGQLLDRVEQRGRMDLIHDYALPIPTTIIAEMLGIPVRRPAQVPPLVEPHSHVHVEPPRRWLAIPAVWFFLRYIRKLIKARRQRPEDDLVTALVQVQESGQHLTDDELLSLVFLLIVAGHETTVNLIGNGMLALIEHPDQLDKLENDPSLVKSAVEELLRFTCPVETATERYAREDVTIGGVTIGKGDMILAAIGSANRDATRFENPDALDITREPNRHLAFGQGIHFCLGAPLARLEAQIAIGALVARCGDLRLAVEPAALRWRPGLVLRGLRALPVTFTAQGSRKRVAEPLAV